MPWGGVAGQTTDVDCMLALENSMPFNLDRFTTAQDRTYDDVLRELRAGRKASHWMWFIFPQLKGLGRSETAQYYGIASLDEARAYLDHPLLGARLRECLSALQELAPVTAEAVFGSLDATKFRSSLTLFAAADPADRAIAEALQRWFAGKQDGATLQLLDR